VSEAAAAGRPPVGGVAAIDITRELATRPRRAADILREVSAFRELSHLMLMNPARAVQRFVDLALDLCDGGTAGLSLLRDGEAGMHFHWEALAGALAASVGGTTPRDFSPCGLCLDAGHTILLRRPYERFDYFRGAAEPLMEGLIVPLIDGNGTPLGTIWVVHHDPDRHFDGEDQRILEQLAVQLVLALKLRRNRSEARTMRREMRSLRAEKADLIDESAFLNSVLSASSDCIKVLDLEGHILFLSEGGFAVMEVDDFAAIRGKYWPDVWGADERPLAQQAVAEAAAGGVGRFQGPVATLKGTPKYWDVRVTAIRGPDGKPQQLLAISRDITLEQNASEMTRTLSRELQHRVKNSLGMVTAIINQTFRTQHSSADIRAVLLSRIAALTHAQDALTAGNWQTASIESVIAAALAPHRSGTGRFELIGPDLTLSAKQALSLTLALHELATNAAKYGALASDHGHIRLVWSVGNGAAAAFVLQWQEVGGPPVTQPRRRGFGSRLIEQIVPADFGGKARIEYKPAGVVYELTAPAANLHPKPDDRFHEQALEPE